MTREGIVLSGVGGRYRVLSDGEELDASLRGRVKLRSADKVLVGDRVTVVVSGDEVTVEGVLPRRSVLQRRSPGRATGIRAVAANIDQVVAVGSVRQPDWNGFLMDRFLVVAEANRLTAILVANKADLASDKATVLESYRKAGYAVVVTSVLRGEGIEELHRHLKDRVSLFTGPTGVGKSSLLNALQPGLSLRTSDVSHRSGAGRHTTVSAEMHPLAGGGFVVDTPGLRDVGLWGVTAAEVADAFPEFRNVGRCRFDNCRHLEEPACAVAAAVEGGGISADRLESYRTLLREALRAGKHWE